jgi:hypothetical protein
VRPGAATGAAASGKVPRARPDDRTAFVAAAPPLPGASQSMPMQMAGESQSMPVSLESGPQPVRPRNQTMVIGTPAGYSDRPPRRMWPFAVAVIGLGVSVGIGAAVLLAADGERIRPIADAGASGAGAAPDGSGAGDAGGDGGSGDAGAKGDATAVEVARYRLVTRPRSATVFDASGAELGVTPTTIELPKNGQEQTLIFRHPDAKELKKTFVPEGDGVIELELELRAPQGKRGGDKPKQRPRGRRGRASRDIMSPF